MGYLHIRNLYQSAEILAFRECYALEKVHGTSAHISLHEGLVPTFYGGGMKHERFVSIFEGMPVTEWLATIGQPQVTFYGEAYGGKEQGMRETYGPAPSFVVFDVKIGDYWLDVPKAEQVATAVGLRFVPYERGPTDLGWLNEQRDRPSIVAAWQDMGDNHKREGVVLRPPFEASVNSGGRIIAKHKRDDFRETKTPRVVGEAELAVLTEAQAIADEWVTPMRLAHVLQQIPDPHGLEQTGLVCKAMVADVERESAGETVMSDAARKAISKAASALFKPLVTRMVA